jgi:hypothetical protein
MSRKNLFAVLGVLGAALGFFAQEFGLVIDPAAVIGSLIIALAYIFGEGKADINRIRAQAGKWKDAKFWIAFLAYIIGYINQAFGLQLPVEIIIGFLTLLLGILFKKDA